MQELDFQLLLQEDAEQRVGGAHTLHELCLRWGLKPFRRFKGFTFFSDKDIDEAIVRKNATDAE